MDIDTILTELQRPFPLDVLQLRVGATNADKTRGIALAYVGWWRGYLPVLNHYIGRRQIRIAVSGPKGDTIAHLSAFDGAIEAWSRGEEEAGDENQGTSSEIQAKRRVCAEGLGLGLYLYHLPKLWGTIEPQGRSFVFPAHVEAQLKHELYATLGLNQIAPLIVPSPCALVVPAPPAPAIFSATPRSAPTIAHDARSVSPSLATARAALATAEHQAGLHPTRVTRSAGAPAPKPASVKQIQRIASDLAAIELLEDRRHIGAGIARVLGRPIDMRRMDDPTYLTSLALSSREASTMIDTIKGITAGLPARAA